MGSPFYSQSIYIFHKKLKSTGFSLIEILMGVALISILSTVGILQYLDFSDEARTALTEQKLNQFKMAVTGDPRAVSGGKYLKPGYEAHCNGIPSVMADLHTMPGAGTCSTAYDPFTKIGWRGPYIDNTSADWDQDGWGTTIVYTSGSRLFRSCGADAACGNSDDIDVNF